MQSLEQLIFSVTEANFEELSLEVFRYQAEYCAVYKQFLAHLGVSPKQVQTLQDIPFLPIELFKQHQIIVEGKKAETIFTSSGTTGMEYSQHLVADLNMYEQSFRQCFEHFYGEISDYCILALLPAYLERKGSSLVYMSKRLIELSEHPQSGFYLYNFEELAKVLQQLEAQNQHTILIGVTFALLDFAEQFPMSLKHTTVMETGGMKGRRKEIIREDLQSQLKQAFDLESIHSEYGMTELLSQAYSAKEGLYISPPWMKVLIREHNDPFAYVDTGQTGAINIIDLANLYSCSFLATSDLGKQAEDQSFQVLGRMDNSDIRGCSLLL